MMYDSFKAYALACVDAAFAGRPYDVYQVSSHDPDKFSHVTVLNVIKHNTDVTPPEHLVVATLQLTIVSYNQARNKAPTQAQATLQIDWRGGREQPWVSYGMSTLLTQDGAVNMFALTRFVEMLDAPAVS